MSFLHYFRPSEHLNSSQNPIWMDGLRILLGLFLFVKGVLFVEYSSDVFRLFSNGPFNWDYQRAHTLTSMVHIIGGLMIASGMLTRLALLCQIPIIMMAALIVDPQQAALTNNTELWSALSIIALLLFFMIVGPGRYSIDNKVLRVKSNPPEATFHS